MVFDVCRSLQREFTEIDYVENTEYKYCGNEPKMKVDPTQQPRESIAIATVWTEESVRAEEIWYLRRVEWRINIPAWTKESVRTSNGLVACPVKTVSVTLLGVKYWKDLERDPIGSTDQLEREKYI